MLYNHITRPKVRSYKIELASLALLVLVFGGAATANATKFYNVNRIIGGGTITGFIETDGTLGVLESGNIADWKFTMTSPNLFGGPNVIIGLSLPGFATTLVDPLGFTATSTQLIFDFDSGDPGAFLFFQGGGGGAAFWCLRDGDGGGCSGANAGEHMGPGLGTAGIAESITWTGQIVIATIVPEPSTMLLLGSGLAGIAFFRRRRKDRQNPSNT